MYLRAISIGYAVPGESFDASIHSVFQSSINLRLNKVNRLLTLTTSSEDDLPQGIRLDAPLGFSFEKFQTGESAVCRDGILHIENSSLTTQLQGAHRYRCDLPALTVDLSKPIVATAWSSVWDALNKRQKHSGAEILAEDVVRPGQPAHTLVSRKAGEAMRDLIHATQHYELTNTTAVKSLLGLGPGLTPSGDDILVGYLAGLWSTVQNKSERLQFISSLGQRIIRLSRATNDISRTYLYHAVRGQVSSQLMNLVRAISQGEAADRLLGVAEAAMSVGHTSGMDTITGMLIGLTIWEGKSFFSF